MLIQEPDDDRLLLLAATPRKWLEDGKQIEIRREPTYLGPLSMTVESHAASGTIRASLGCELSTLANRGTKSWPPTERRKNNMTAIWIGVLALAAGAADPAAVVPQAAPASGALADEVRAQGWIAYAARSDERDWDIFVWRPALGHRHDRTRASAKRTRK